LLLSTMRLRVMVEVRLRMNGQPPLLAVAANNSLLVCGVVVAVADAGAGATTVVGVDVTVVGAVAGVDAALVFCSFTVATVVAVLPLPLPFFFPDITPITP
jgi:hypothetical protein